ncbi:MAG: hypothetical protein U0163_07710 [Gemmatimonadaceae bacterium]
MSLYPQPNRWQCGPFALKHALVTLGISASERVITEIAGAGPSLGADEAQLRRAARKFHCDMPPVRRHDAAEAREQLLFHLKHGHPCLICVRQWAHWITIVKAEAGKFIVLDSEDDAVLSVFTWRKLQRVWPYRERDKHDKRHVVTLYDLYPVVPGVRVRTRAQFSLARARYLRRPEHRRLAAHWDDYLADLLSICRPRTALSSHVVSMGEFFRRYDTMILDQVDYWHGEVNRQSASRVLRNMHFVADTYGLVIHEEDEKRAIAGISAILALWAASKVHVAPFY